jgi:hypothetical protein
VHVCVCDHRTSAPTASRYDAVLDAVPECAKLCLVPAVEQLPVEHGAHARHRHQGPAHATRDRDIEWASRMAKDRGAWRRGRAAHGHARRSMLTLAPLPIPWPPPLSCPPGPSLFRPTCSTRRRARRLASRRAAPAHASTGQGAGGPARRRRSEPALALALQRPGSQEIRRPGGGSPRDERLVTPRMAGSCVPRADGRSQGHRGGGLGRTRRSRGQLGFAQSVSQS